MIKERISLLREFPSGIFRYIAKRPITPDTEMFFPSLPYPPPFFSFYLYFFVPPGFDPGVEAPNTEEQQQFIS